MRTLDTTSVDRAGSDRRRLVVVLVLLLVAMAAVVTGARWLAFVDVAPEAGSPAVDAGRDYRAFAVAGSLASDGDGAGIYDESRPEYTSANAAVYVYPPWFALGMQPWSGLDFQPGYWLWLGTTLLIAVGAAAVAGVRVAAITAVVLVVSAPGLQTIFYGQSGYLVVAGAFIVTWATARHRAMIEGTSLALMSFKPHLLLGVGIVELTRGRTGRKSVLIAAVGSLALLAVSEMALNGSVRAWISAVTAESTSLVDPRAEVTLAAFIDVAVPGTLPWWGRFVVLATGLGWLVSVRLRKDLDPGTVMAAAFGVAVVCGLHALAYDVLVLVGPLAMAWRARPADRWWIALGAATVLAFITLGGVVLALQGGSAGLMPGPIALAAFVVWLAESSGSMPDPRSATERPGGMT